MTYVGLMKFGASETSQWVIARNTAGHAEANQFSSLGREPDLHWYPSGQNAATFTPPNNEWVIVVATKTAGSTKAKYWYYRFSTGLWASSESSAAFTSLRNVVPVEFQLGRWNGVGSEQFTGRYAAAAVFNYSLSEAEVKALATATSIQGWLAIGTGPKALWTFNQNLVTEEVKDLTGGGANEISREGTTVAAEEPPIPYGGPEVVTGGTNTATTTTVNVEGTVDPNGEASTWYFEYGTTKALGTKSSTAVTGTGTTPEAKTKSLSGLTSGTKYFYRIAAENAKGTALGEIQFFVTAVEGPSKTGSPSLPNAYVLPQIDVAAQRQVRIAATVEPPSSEPITIGPDELEAARDLLSVSWETELPGGFGPGNFTIPLPTGVAQPSTWLLGGFRIYDADTDQTYYEGRVTNVSSDTSGGSVAVETEGWAKHLSDDSTAREIFIDRDLAGWGEPSVQRKINLWAGGFDLSKMTITTGGASATETRPSILITFNQGVEGATERNEFWYYGNGIDIGKFRYNFIAPKPGGLGAEFFNYAKLYNDDVATEVNAEAVYHTTPVSTQTLTANKAGIKYCAVVAENQRASFNTPTTGDTWGYGNVCVIGRHGLTEYGTWPDIGLLVSDMAAYAVNKWAPLLNFSTGPEGSIETTSFAVPHSSFADEGTVTAMLEAWSLFGGATAEPLQWGVYEMRQFFMSQATGFGRVWRVRQDQTAKSQNQGADASERINGVRVTYDRGDGIARSVGPVGSQSTIETDELRDFNPSNPANADNARHWVTYNAGVMNDEQAKLVAGLILAKSREERWRGSITIEGWGYDEAGVPIPADMARAGDWVIVEDDDSGDTAPRQMRNTSVDGVSKVASCSVGAPPDMLDVLLARAGVVLQGNT